MHNQTPEQDAGFRPHQGGGGGGGKAKLTKGKREGKLILAAF